MLLKILNTIKNYKMLQSGDRVIVALSGGADSVALLKALLLLREELDITLTACHVNHNLRGDNSGRDERFTRELCETLGVPAVIRSIDVAQSRVKHQSIEEAAREARYAVFAEAAAELTPPVKTATAHTASDNAETVLLNLIRGTALKGLCGIPPVRGNIIRPLIDCSREEIEAFCREQELDYVTDETNFSEDYTRNKIRLSLLPLIREMNPSFCGGITRMCGALREDEDLLEEAAAIAAEKSGYAVNALRELKKPLLNRIIGGLLSQNNISPSYLRITQIAELIETGKGKINLKKNKFAVISDEMLKIVTIHQKYRKK